MVMHNLLEWSLWAAILEDASRAPMTERLLWAILVAGAGISAFVSSLRHRAAHRALKGQLRHHLDALAKAEKTTEHLRKGAATAQTARHSAEVAEAQHRRKAFDAKTKIALLEADVAQERAHTKLLEEEAQRLRASLAAADEGTRGNRPRAPSTRAAGPKSRAAPADAEALAVPQKAADPTPPASPAPPSREAILDEELRALRLAFTAQAAEEKERLRRALAELRGAKKRVEDLRRIDLMSRNKVSLLEDRLARLGREHYEAISALCAARGETPEAHPRPRAEEPSSLQH